MELASYPSFLLAGKTTWSKFCLWLPCRPSADSWSHDRARGWGFQTSGCSLPSEWILGSARSLPWLSPRTDGDDEVILETTRRNQRTAAQGARAGVVLARQMYLQRFLESYHSSRFVSSVVVRLFAALKSTRSPVQLT